METERSGKETRSPLLAAFVELIDALTTRRFCATLLKQLNANLRVDHCSLMRSSPGRAIQLFGAHSLPPFEALGARAVVRYVDEFHRFDAMLRTLRSSELPAGILVCRERRSQLRASAYRHACFDDPGIVDRLSIVKHDARDGWIVLDLRRQEVSGEFSDTDRERLGTIAPLLATACLRHIDLLVHAGADAAAWRVRLAADCPTMSGRELDVAAHLLAGSTLREAAEALGVAHSSVVTYCERAYARLGIANLRELRSRFATRASTAAIGSAPNRIGAVRAPHDRCPAAA